MNSGPRRRWLRFSLLTLFIGVTAAGVGLGFVGSWWQVARDFRDARQSFPRRHVEARETIEAVYAYFSQGGRWPERAEIGSMGKPLPPPGWEYEVGSGLGAPVIVLHGPFRMMICYYFAPPNQGTASDQWTLSIEGDKNTFRSAEPYRVQVRP